MGRIYYIMGKSCSGKDTIYRRLKQEYPDFRSITLYTTRPIRDGEQNGREYYFVTDKKMEEMKSEGKIIEMRSYNTKCGIWTYFTADDGQIDLDRYNYFVIGTLVSYRAVCDYFGENKIIPVYIEVDDGIRLERGIERERKQPVPQYAEMCRRFLADSEDFSEDRLRDAGIDRRFENQDIEKCLAEIEAYIG